jgi:hypothetical protein
MSEGPKDRSVEIVFLVVFVLLVLYATATKSEPADYQTDPIACSDVQVGC